MTVAIIIAMALLGAAIYGLTRLAAERTPDTTLTDEVIGKATNQETGEVTEIRESDHAIFFLNRDDEDEVMFEDYPKWLLNAWGGVKVGAEVLVTRRDGSHLNARIEKVIQRTGNRAICDWVEI